MYNALNGSTYLTNPTYMPSGWSERIVNWIWSAVNTKTSTPSINNGMEYGYVTAQNIYYHEIQKGIEARNCKKNSGNAISCTIGEWTQPQAQVGLMYVSDYALSLGKEALTMISHTNKDKLKTGWIHLSNNVNFSKTEYTMSRFGKYNGRAWAYALYPDGYIESLGVINYFYVRPVFYLNQFQVIQSGDGKIDNPYILQ